MSTRSFRQDRVTIVKNLSSLLVLACLLSSCVSSKNLALFQEGPNTTIDSLSIAKQYTPTVQIGDVLSITVTSLNPEASAVFNLPESQALIQGQGLNASANPLAYQPGYVVNKDGSIDFPMLGKIPVTGKSSTEINAFIKDKLKAYLKEPSVNVRNVNFRISVLGEVNHPSLFLINNEQVTLLQALSMANDLTIYGKRENVLIIREENGKKTFARINLNRRDFFSSPYYYLHPNDVVYVEPNQARAAATDNTYRVVPIVISAVSAVLVLVSVIIR
ncbi:sugar transporter [Siphonobacter sp. BAB-5385]|uniref:polysaccharide biosynthesis/export family protein n=1 Tax=Siphonobacter sp. BAB-5405 TaxID=1864825 RepID=UPI000B9EA91C|nr:polysaccharide biosynthesis/export family protein [Siphonobacter sp. BAB-5405]OZI06352.1 sugar transporter [Siphonobacter sp. BAB-5385]PMD92744.1 sugar transporter [Siphonobacter sp. BAB-5405]